MKTTLHVADDLKLPTDFVTSTAIVYGGKGQGKTNLGAVLMEELSRCGLRFAALDPMGVLWGLRFDVSGKGPGIEVLILGGIHGDIPIEPTGGAVVADLVADEEASVVIDISRRPDGTMWSIGERIRFVTDYCKRLYQRQGEKRRPLMQLLDEAARFVPQMVRHGEPQLAACVGAVAVLVEEGRNVGIGVTLITQRSARLSKDVAELADAMIAFRTIGPNSSEAVLDWLGEHVEKKRLHDLGAKLRELPVGSALVVSPGWLKFEGVVRFRARQTFDSSATPKPGEAVKKVSGGAKPDLAKYAARMAETIERAKANDPKALQAQVKALEAEVKKLQAAKVPAAKVEIREVYVLKDGQLKRIEKIIERGMATVEKSLSVGVVIRQGLAELAGVVAPAMAAEFKPPPVPPRGFTPPTVPARPMPRPMPVNRPAIAPRTAADDQEATGPLPKGERIVLTAIAQHQQGVTRQQLTVLTGYKRSTRDSYLQRLAERGAVGVDGDRIFALLPGLLGENFQPLPTGAALLDHWRQKLPKGEREVLEVAIAQYPQAVSRDAISEATTFARSSRDSYLQRLRSRRLVDEVGRGEIRASAELFDGAGA